MSRIFVSFAMEDKFLRDSFVAQKRNTSNNIDFTDYSVKEPWENSWKTQCRTRIQGCKGVIGIITQNTTNADGQLWELKCAYEENIPVLLIHGHSTPDKRIINKPDIIINKLINNWTHENILIFLNKVS